MDKLYLLGREILVLIKKNRFLDALKKIDQGIDKDPNNHHFYYLRGATQIFLQRTDDALMDLGEAAYLNPQHIPTMHALAYIFLKKEDYEGAFNKWISILEFSPKDKLAKKHLNRFKKKPPVKASLNLNPKLYLVLPKIKIKERFAKPPVLKKEKKPLKKSFSFFKWFFTLLLALFTLLVSFWIYRYFKGQPFKFLPFINTIASSFSEKEREARLEFLTSQNLTIAYSFTEKEIEFYKKQVYDFVSKQQYNQAKILLNKLYLSNASIDDKKLLKAWEARLEFPTAQNLDVFLTPKEIFDNWKVSEGCFVLWEGEAQEVVQKSQMLSFLLKIKEDKKVRAVFFSNYPLQSNEKIKVLAKIRKAANQEIDLEIYQIEKK